MEELPTNKNLKKMVEAGTFRKAKADKHELHYKQLIGMLDRHEITGSQLSEVLNYLYARFHYYPSQVAQWLMLETDPEKREFYSKIRYLRKKGVIEINGLPPLGPLYGFSPDGR